MTVATNQTEIRGIPNVAELKTLAKLRDENEACVTAYFELDRQSISSGAAIGFETERFLKEFEQQAAAGSREPLIRRDDLSAFRRLVETEPTNFHYFLSSSLGEVSMGALPAPLSISTAQRGYCLNLLPLLQAAELCTPVMVLLLESDKARLFFGGGMKMMELTGALPHADLSVRADDSRVGWSHRIDSNVAHRSLAYWHELALLVADEYRRLEAQCLVISCREDLWGHAQHCFESLRKLCSMRTLPFTAFDMSAHEVAVAAAPVVEQLRRERYDAFTTDFSDAGTHSVSGVVETLSALEGGLVATMAIGNLPAIEILECSGCGRSQPAGQRYCTFCSTGRLYPISADALLTAKALATDVTILAMKTPGIPVRAILRF